jgi:hypothetical protein
MNFIVRNNIKIHFLLVLSHSILAAWIDTVLTVGRQAGSKPCGYYLGYPT